MSGGTRIVDPMSPRHSLIRLRLMRSPRFVCFVAVVVALVPLAMWFDRYEETQDREDRQTVTVVALEVVDQGNDKMVSIRHRDELFTVAYPGKIAVGDELAVYRNDDGQWQAAKQSPLWVPVAASLLLWIPSGVVLWKYVPALRRRRDDGGASHPPGPVSGPV